MRWHVVFVRTDAYFDPSSATFFCQPGDVLIGTFSAVGAAQYAVLKAERLLRQVLGPGEAVLVPDDGMLTIQPQPRLGWRAMCDDPWLEEILAAARVSLAPRTGPG